MAVIQKMASVPVLPLGSYPNQSRTLPDANGMQVASDVTSIDFNIACCTAADPAIWPNVTTVLTIVPEVSTDNGVTWVEAGKSVTPGGTHTFKGAEISTVRSGGSLPAQIGAVLRLYRVTLTIEGGPLRSSATVEVN